MSKMIFHEDITNSIFEVIKCPLCKNDKYEIITSRGQYEIPLNVSICPRCGLVYLNPRWKKEVYNQFYKKEYDKYYRNYIFAYNKTNYTEQEIIFRRVINFIPKKINNILEIGAGTGKNLIYLLNIFRNSHAYAIEMSERCLNILKFSSSINVLSNDVDSCWQKKFNKKFELIIMRHVLEHLLDPISVLKKVYASLNVNGIAYISVPNMMKPKRTLEKYWFRVVHTFYFSKYTLLEMMIKSGLKPMELGTENHEIYGIFYKSSNNDFKINNIYKKQKKLIIKNILIERFFYNKFSILRTKIKKIKRYIKNRK